jgi:hypothetical protein
VALFSFGGWPNSAHMAMRERVLEVLFTVALGALSAGCNTYGMKEVPYSIPAPPGPNETLIYVFRDDAYQGVARPLTIIDNGTVVAVLTRATFSHFTVPSGEHEIVRHHYAGLIPEPVTMHFRIGPAPGKTIYLFCSMGGSRTFRRAEKGSIDLIDEERARQLILEFTYTEIEASGLKLGVR